MPTYVPFSETFLGSAATGSNKATDRTITLSKSTAISAGMVIIVDGTSLHQGSTKDYTVSGAVVTFKNALFNDSNIDINYFYLDSTSTSQSQYATPLQVSDFMQLTKSIPNYPKTTTLETVDNSGTLTTGSVIYLDQRYLIDDTLTLSYGASASSVTDLTEDTHYTVDVDKSQITLTAAGASAIGTALVFSEYKYNELIKNSLISDLIDSASADIEDETHQVFGTTTLNIREEHIGKGKFKRVYRPKNLKLYFAKSQLSSALGSTATTVALDDTTGFTAGDYITIGKDVSLITSVDSSTALTVTRSQLGTTGTTHSVDDWCVNTVLENSNTPVGSSPNYNILEFRKDYDIDSDTGAIQLLHINSEDRDDLADDVYPLQGIMHRVRMTYRYGSTSVPDDIILACKYKVAYDLTMSGIAKALPDGRNGFNPTAQRDLLKEYKRLLYGSRQLLADGF